jgi:hypothetical protein
LKRLNPRRVKLHRNYTVEEVARLFEAHKNTVRNWIKSGLETVDGRRPTLILGRRLSAFLHARRTRARQRCGQGQFYCFRCRAPRDPTSHKADYVPTTPTSGNLRGTCADCGARMYRRTSLRKLAAVAGDLQVQLQQAEQRIADSAVPSPNCDLAQVANAEADASPGQ